ncbi:hypothetical protein D3C85_1573710 [compost metagenome]
MLSGRPSVYSITMYTVLLARKKFTTRTILGCWMPASTRASSKKHFRPTRNASRSSSSMMVTSPPGWRRVMSSGRYSLIANLRSW